MTQPKESDAHYAGAGTKLGDAKRQIFWYKPVDSDNYRVVYADLSIKDSDVAPDVENAVKLTP